MNSQAELDRMLTSWLSAGAERAPDRHVASALERVAVTNQRRPTRWGRPDSWRRVAAFAIAGLLLVVLGVGIGVGVGVIRLPIPPPTQIPVPSPEATAESEDGTSEVEMVPFADPDGLFDMRAPRIWITSVEQESIGEGSRSLRFGNGSESAHATQSPGLRIVIGQEDGSMVLCADCPAARVRTLDDLEGLVVSMPSRLGVAPPEVRGDLILGGEHARSAITGISGECSACGDAYFHIFTVHDQRAIVLMFDYWNVRSERLILPNGRRVPFTRATLNELLASFRFLDGPTVDDQGTFVAPDGSFEIADSRLTLADGPDPSALYLNTGGTAISIRSGVSGGSVRSCDDSRPTFEHCVAIRGTTLEDLAEAVGVPRHADPPTMWEGPNETEITLDGEPALLITMIGSDNRGGMHPASLAYIVAIHDERPFIVRAFRPDGTGLAGLPSLLEGFRFR